MKFFQWLKSIFSPPPTRAPNGPVLTGWLSSYDALVKASITPTMLDAAPGDLAPSLSKATLPFWLALLKATAKVESSWNPNDVYQENFKDAATGQLALSCGLLQLSVGDNLNYPLSPALTPESIFVPAVNIQAGIKIMSTRILRDGSIPLRQSLGKYWSSIRDGKVDQYLEQYLQEYML